MELAPGWIGTEREQGKVVGGIAGGIAGGVAGGVKYNHCYFCSYNLKPVGTVKP